MDRDRRPSSDFTALVSIPMQSLDYRDMEEGEIAAAGSSSPKSNDSPKRKSLTHRSKHRPRRDEAFPDQYRGGGGQSYRPGGARERSPEPRGRTPLSGPPSTRPTADTYRVRSPARRSEYSDAYRGPTRPRSRSPAGRDEYPRRRTPEPQSRYRDERDVRDVRDVRDARDSRGDAYRGRPRSPPPSARREELPRDDLFRRDPPPRDYARDDRGGYAAPRAEAPRYRERSPLPLKRGRDTSPMGSRGRRTPPPPAKRERLNSPPRGRYDDYPPSRAASPPRRRFSPDPRDRRPAPPPRDMSRGYRRSSRSPIARQERVDPRTIEDWRKPRSPSPIRYNGGREYEMQDQGRSVATSRQSSPPPHPSSRQSGTDDRSGRAVPSREPYEREPYRQRSLERAAPRAQNEYNDDRYAPDDSRVPPPREPKRADDITLPVRAPPTGPSGYRAPSGSAAPPSGPAAAAVPISAHQRAPIAPPSGPRAAATAPCAPRGDFVPRGRGGFRGGFGGAPFRGGRGGAAGPGFGRSESFQQQQQQQPQQPPPQQREGFDSTAAPPTGPRGSFGQSQAPPVQASGPPSGPGGFRQSNNNSTTTYPRTQRFAPNGAPIPDGPPQQQSRDSATTSTTAVPPSGPRLSRRPTEPALTTQQPKPPGIHPSLSDLPAIIPGGQKADPLVDLTRLQKLQDEAEKLRRDIEVKEERKRRNLRDWERMGREVEVAGLRSELAERAVRELDGEGEGEVAF
ncbi:hypothetical protein LTS14_005727 [Recurvomyces mirabilis]|uniref:uncharacterized protein n=1 Tax=Recurvomyces mirabilis TaxID=574656 RepID=UPI002DE11A41|nr:hypothetical protein LTS14_005727 [Recurvomyces mirabilis]